jgi:chromosome segregation ATPase
LIGSMHNLSPPQDRGAAAHPPQGAPPTATTPRLALMQQQQPQSVPPPAPSQSRDEVTPPGGHSDPDGEFPQQRKKEKKEKKDRKAKKAKSAAQLLEQKAFLGALPDDEVCTVLKEYGLEISARAAVNDLLQRQRTALLATFTSRSEEVASDAQTIAGDREQTAELLAAFAQLQEEVDVLRGASNKQKSQLEKSKAVAEKKMLEVAQLKEHIDALRDELASQQSKSDAALKEHEERLIHQFNKKTEALVAKHAKNLAKERKQRDFLDNKIDELVAQMGRLEQDYDTKILEYENLMRDYEDLKVENLRRFREVHANGMISPSAEVSVPKMKRVVQASVVLDKLSGRNQVVKTEEMRPEPNSAPEVLHSNGTTPLPSVSPLPGINRNVFQRPLPF